MTIKELAEAAGVSRGTVDRVLHNRKGVAPEIEARIRKIAKEMGYTPNRAGKMLNARKQPLTIGCLLPSIGNNFYLDVIRGLHKAESELKDFGVSIVLRQVRGYHIGEHLAALKELRDLKCSALCISTIDTPEIRRFTDDTIRSGIPVVTVNTDLTDTQRLCYVGPNYQNNGSTAAGLLTLCATSSLQLLIVTGSRTIKGHNERIMGFKDTLDQNGIRYRLVDILEAQDDDGYAYEVTSKALKDNPDINCVYIVAAGVKGVCQAICEVDAKKHKQDFHVLSFDDIPTTQQLIRDGVIDFTICQEPEKQGSSAIHLLFNYFLFGKKNAPKDQFTDTVIKIKQNL